jgi:hypothetical protein
MISTRGQHERDRARSRVRRGFISGTGSVTDPDLEQSQALIEDSVVHVEAGTAYQFIAERAGMDLIGGPCPPDPALYRHLEFASIG